MKIEHLAIWTKDLERMKDFYTRFFNGTANQKYFNPNNNFTSYFITYDGGARLELMSKTDIPENKNQSQHMGLTHFAFGVNSKKELEVLTDKLRAAGYAVIDGPRVTGDGYYESTVLDPEDNRVEIAFRIEA